MLQVLQPVPPQLTQDAEVVQSGYREYQELTLSRRGLKRLYALTLTLTLLLALLSAAALAFVLSDRLSAPLGELVEGTRAVASGDFSRRAAVASRDEIGMLTQSFNSMTLQLADARAAAERHEAELAQAKAYLESILANLSAGVLAFDENLRLRSANRSAGNMLGVDFAPLLGPRARALERGRAGAGGARAASSSRRSHDGGSGEWEQQLERAASRRHAAAAAAGHAPAAGRARRVRRRVRRHHPPRAGAARGGVGRGGAAARPRDPQSAHADPAFRRAAAEPSSPASSPAPTPRCWRARPRPSSTRWRR